MIKPLSVSLILAYNVATIGAPPIQAAPQAANSSARHAQVLRFARGAYTLNERAIIHGSQHRFYTLRVNAGQRLKISAVSDAKTKSQLVPLIFVTPPGGKFNGDKTAKFTDDSSCKGVYLIEVAANQMASQANYGAFVLRVEAR